MKDAKPKVTLPEWWATVSKKELADMLKNVNPSKQGSMVDHHVRVQVISTLLRVMQFHKKKSTPKKAITTIINAHALAHNVSATTLREILKLFVQSGGKELPRTHRKQYRHDETKAQISKEHREEIDAFVVKNARAHGNATKLPAILRHLRRTFPGTRFRSWVVRYCLKHSMGWVFVKIKEQYYDLDSEDAQKIFKEYVIRLDKYLKLEIRGKAVIVYIDESYLNEGHHNSWVWMDPRRASEFSLQAKKKGRRLIAIDALTKFGRLSLGNKCESEILKLVRQKQVPPADAPLETGMYVWAQTDRESEVSDYHGTMDSDMFVKYIKNRVYPAFKARFGTEKRMILVMDNAKYHKTLTRESIRFSGKPALKKTDYTRWLRDNGVTKIRISANRRALRQATDNYKKLKKKWEEGAHESRGPEPQPPDRSRLPADQIFELGHPVWNKNGNKGIYDWEAKDAVKAVLCEKPYLRKYKLTECLKELSIADTKTEQNPEGDPYFHTVIFTPCYRCRCQPAETMWNFIKSDAADNLVSQSKFYDVMAAWVEATMKVTDLFCSNWVRSSIEYNTNQCIKYGISDRAVGDFLTTWEETYASAPRPGPVEASVVAAEYVADATGQAEVPADEELDQEPELDAPELQEFDELLEQNVDLHSE